MNIRTSTVRDKVFYDIVTALRGPDASQKVGAVSAKHMTTAVLRSLAGLKSGLGGSVVSVEKAKEDWLGYTKITREEVKAFIKSERHFRDHLHSAFKALSRNSSRARSYYTFLKQAGVL